MANSFNTYHPAVNFTFFAAVIVCTLLFMNPLFLGISLTASVVYSLLLTGKKALRLQLRVALPMLIAVAVFNPLFVHQGMTILFYLNDNPITLEAVEYGAAAAAMLVSILLWFACYNEVMTSDKFLYLFGRLIPSLSLLLSMTLRLIPRLKTQIGQISYAQKAVGMDAGTGNLIQRARNGMRILSILMTWAMENAVETADSMKARGYGLSGRTSFSIFRFDRRDAACLAVLTAALVLCIAGHVSGAAYFQYYPDVKGAAARPFTVVMAVSYASLCFLPSVLELWEGYKWRSLKSTI